MCLVGPVARPTGQAGSLSGLELAAAPNPWSLPDGRVTDAAGDKPAIYPKHGTCDVGGIRRGKKGDSRSDLRGGAEPAKGYPTEPANPAPFRERSQRKIRSDRTRC